MTISNETKVGALTAIAIALLILGFNFLKGKSFNGKNTHYTAAFDDIQGLTTSNPVVLYGKQVGTVSDIGWNDDKRTIKVGIGIKDDINITEDAYAVITKSLLGTVQVEIRQGTSSKIIPNGGSIKTNNIPDPLMSNITSATASLDRLLSSANDILDTSSKHNLKVVLQNLNHITASLAVTTNALQQLVAAQSSTIAKTLSNTENLTASLQKNTAQLGTVMDNAATATGNLAKLDLQSTLTGMNNTITELKNTIANINSSNGTLGLLLNDSRLYNNLNATSNKLNLLLDDFRIHPKRYVNISVFGKKDKSGPLMQPLPDTVNAPYIKP
ncbi:MAG TPA: MlaD family protein [Ferruginibacter sp.]|nr:MlaD family protein [Ferruginibacter sp.]HMP22001.1 MlaD family protein [Ferruginibacter sp.]